MKTTALILTLATLMMSCGGHSTSDTNLSDDSVNASKHATAARQSEVDTSIGNIGTNNEPGAAAGSGKGAQLITSSDCLTCHKENEKLIGPSYAEIAAKYPNTPANVEMLAGKILSGGAGNWGEIPMTPHPGLSKHDAEEMTKYILSVK